MNIKQRKIKIAPRTKLNYHVYMAFFTSRFYTV